MCFKQGGLLLLQPAELVSHELIASSGYMVKFMLVAK